MAFRRFLLRRGLAANLPTLAEGEPGFTTDGKDLYIGTSDGNVKMSKDGHTHSYVPTTRKINDKALTSDISLTASDVGAATLDHTHTGYVPIERKVNNKTLSSDISLSASDVGAAPAYQYSTTDLEAGVSPLTTGTLYLVYQE